MTRPELHRLIDEMPEASWDAVAVLLRRARDPLVAKLDAAPYDDEELTEADLRAVRAARDEPSVPWPDAGAALSAG